METVYIKELRINKVRNLQNINIQIADQELRHLIITGKNGSGKTSLLDSLSRYLYTISTSNDPMEAEKMLQKCENTLTSAQKNNQSESEIREIDDCIKHYKQRIANAKNGIDIYLSCPCEKINEHFQDGDLVIAYYKAERSFAAISSTTVEKVELKDTYTLKEKPRENLVKYLLDMKMTQALALNAGKQTKVDQIQHWFDSFEKLLQSIFEDTDLKLVFDEETFLFHIQQPGKEPFDFNTLSSGYAAVLDIVVDIMMRMEKHSQKQFIYDLPGIVLIDEVETHLHLEMQKKIMELLTTFFPKIQFIVTTHSPFVLNSISNATIFDLENKTLVRQGLSDIPYSGIVEGYYNVSELSDKLESKFDRYRSLVKKENITDDDLEEISDLELYLDEIPDYLALGITTEYQKLKLEFEKREEFA